MTRDAVDGYQALKSLVLSRFAGRKEGANAVRLEDEPDAGQAKLAAELSNRAARCSGSGSSMPVTFLAASA